MLKLFKNANVLQPDFSFKKAAILIQDDLIYDILEPEQKPLKSVDAEFDLDGHFVFPGLINGHDHLVDTCWKGLGQTPADNWFEWDSSVRSSEEYKAMQRLSVTDLYILGMYKNILSGATTVIDHFPQEISKTFFNHQLTTLVEHMNLVHSVSEKQLHWGRGIEDEYRATRGILPFVLHMGQGSDRIIKQELETLNRLGALESNTVLVDCCHLNETELQLVAAKKASIVWLPSASAMVFARQPEIARILDLGIPFCIGTESANTGSKGILCALKAALHYSEENLDGRLSAKDLVKAATQDAARIFGIEKIAGSLLPGRNADMIVFKCNEDQADPFSYFLGLSPENLSMVVHRGAMIVGNDEFRKVSAIDFSLYSEVRFNNTAKILYGRPIQLIERINHKLDRTMNFPFFPIQAED